jgi:hypothetical protein
MGYGPETPVPGGFESRNVHQFATMVESADTTVLEAVAERRGGSTPSGRTNPVSTFMEKKKVLIIGDLDNALVAALAKAFHDKFPVAHPAKDCSCECHQSIPGRWHCFAICCDEPDVIISRGCF